MADMIELVDRDLRAAAVQMRTAMAAFSPMTLERLATRRRWLSANVAPPRADVGIEQRETPRPDGGPGVPIYIVNAQPGAAAKPAILHMHGGGFTASTAMAGMRNVQDLAAALDCPIVTVDYRLAPETTYRGSIEDNYAALLWTYRNGRDFGIDPGRIGLLGESAGGGHAALLAITARDRGEVPLAFQALVYPMLDDRTGSSRRQPEHIGYYGWNAEANRFGWQCFLGCEPGGGQVPEGAVPARVDDLSGLPPTFLGVGALDVLVQDSIDYAARLITAAVPTELVVVPGAFHGFDMLVRDAAVARRFTAVKLDALRRGLGLAPAAGRVAAA